MVLSAEQELLEHQLRVEQMQTNIEKMRKDMRNEVWKIGISLLVGAVACVAAGAAMMNYLDHHYIPAAQSQGKP